eukprot:TRINITY_DN1371_c0_g1_i2.p1 TRINITY_DN1371_c0_g1~~TRINITY_DN1371_c0_g1_i2.p1  ORF type:complete len:1233 (-),score=220.28 TRINITY_DN1371_c0_g1_i2:114-3776(-)
MAHPSASLAGVLILVLVLLAFAGVAESRELEDTFYFDFSSDVAGRKALSQDPCEPFVTSEAFPLPRFVEVFDSIGTNQIFIPTIFRSVDEPVLVTASVYSVGEQYTMTLFATDGVTTPVAEMKVNKTECSDWHTLTYERSGGETDYYLVLDNSGKFASGDSVLFLEPSITFSTNTNASVTELFPQFLNTNCSEEIVISGNLDLSKRYEIFYSENVIRTYYCDHLGHCPAPAPTNASSIVTVLEDGHDVFSQSLYTMTPTHPYVDHLELLVERAPGGKFTLHVPEFKIGEFFSLAQAFKNIMTVSFQGYYLDKPVVYTPLFPPTFLGITSSVLYFEVFLPVQVDLGSQLVVAVDFGQTCSSAAGTILVSDREPVKIIQHLEEVVVEFKESLAVLPEREPDFCHSSGSDHDFPPFGFHEFEVSTRSQLQSVHLLKLLGTSNVIIDSINFVHAYTKGPFLFTASIVSKTFQTILPTHGDCFETFESTWDLGFADVDPLTFLNLEYNITSFVASNLLPPRVVISFHFPSSSFQGYIPRTQLFRNCTENVVEIQGFDLFNHQPEMRVETVERRDTTENVHCRVVSSNTECPLPKLGVYDETDSITIRIVNDATNEVVYSRIVSLHVPPSLAFLPPKVFSGEVRKDLFVIKGLVAAEKPEFRFHYFSVFTDKSGEVKMRRQSTDFYHPILSDPLATGNVYIEYPIPFTFDSPIRDMRVSVSLRGSCEEQMEEFFLLDPISPLPLPSPWPSSSPTPVMPSPSTSPTPSSPSPTPTPVPTPSPSPTPTSNPVESENPFSPLIELVKNNLVVVTIVGLSVLTLIGGLSLWLCLRCCKKSGQGVRSDVSYHSLESSDIREFTITPKDLRLVEEVGRGAFAIVYRGKWRGVEVAIKKIVNIKDVDEVEVLFKESNTMMSLRHPHIISYLGTSADKETIYIVTAYAHLGPLKKILRNTRYTLEPGHCFDFVIQIARGMDYLHAQGLIHRDLKSDNVLVDSQWTLKVADFGLSKFIKDENEHTLTAVGTPFWAAPEILRSDKYSLKADVYSFAMVIWEIVAREKPYSGEKSNQFELIYQIVMRAKRPSLPDEPKALVALCKSCWQSDPEARPAFPEICTELDLMEYTPPRGHPVYSGPAMGKDAPDSERELGEPLGNVSVEMSESESTEAAEEMVQPERKAESATLSTHAKSSTSVSNVRATGVDIGESEWESGKLNVQDTAQENEDGLSISW